MGTVPNLPMREMESLEHIYEAGKKYGLYQAEKIINSATMYAGTNNNGVDRKQILRQLITLMNKIRTN